MDDVQELRSRDTWLDSHVQAVAVVSLQDGLLVKAWSSEGSWPTDTVAPYVADVFRRIVTLVAMAQRTTEIVGVTLELEDEKVLFSEVWPGYVGLFVFPVETPLGLARVEIERTLPRVKRAVWQLEPE